MVEAFHISRWFRVEQVKHVAAHTYFLSRAAAGYRDPSITGVPCQRNDYKGVIIIKPKVPVPGPTHTVGTHTMALSVRCTYSYLVGTLLKHCCPSYVFRLSRRLGPAV